MNQDATHEAGLHLPVAALILVAISGILYSIARAPYLTEVSEVALAVSPSPSPTLLYRNKKTEIFITTEDLLTSRLIANSSLSIQAIVFDVPPRSPSDSGSRNALDLTWTRLIWAALAHSEGGTANAEAASAFLDFVGQRETVPAGASSVFQVPNDSGFRHSSGIRAIGAIATMAKPVAGLHTPPPSDLLPSALAKVFSQLHEAQIATVGIPRLSLASSDGAPLASSQGWLELLRAIHTTSGTGSPNVVIGLWGIANTSREANVENFRSAWQEFQRQLAQQAKTPVHAELRLWSIATLTSAISYLARRQHVTMKRAFALAVSTAALAASIAALSANVQSHLSLSPATWLLLNGLVAVICGIAIRPLLSFNAKDILLEKETKK